MGRFAELQDAFNESIKSDSAPISERFRRASAWIAEAFPTAVAASHLALANVEPPATRGIRVLVGITLWSLADLVLLDRIDEHMETSRIDVSVDVMDLDQATVAQLQRQFPKLARVSVTPLAGVWLNTVCVTCAQGYKAQQLVARNLGMKLNGLARLQVV